MVKCSIALPQGVRGEGSVQNRHLSPHASPLTSHEFPRKMFDRGQYWIGCSPSQGTETGSLHGLTEVGQEDEILRGSLATLNPLENFTTTHRSNPAGCAFAAGFVRGEG